MFRTEYDHLLKFILIGDSGVGKSSLLRRFSDNEFSDYNQPRTIGVDFRFRTVELDGKIIKLQIWDTNGQERFRTMNHAYYKDAHGILVVFDMTDEQSFNNTKQWLTEIERYAPKNVSKIFVGAKSDLVQERQVSIETAQAFADELGIPYIITSSKNGTLVDQAFLTLSRKVLPAITLSEIKKQDVPTPTQPQTKGFFGNITRSITNLLSRSSNPSVPYSRSQHPVEHKSAQEVKIEELQRKIAELERGREQDKASIKALLQMKQSQNDAPLSPYQEYESPDKKLKSVQFGYKNT